MEILKEKILRKKELQDKRDAEANRLIQARKFFQVERNQAQLTQARKLLEEITINLQNFESEIQKLDVEIVERIEIIACGEVAVKVADKENSLHENNEGYEFLIDLNNIESLWIAKTAKKMFGVEFRDIEIKK